MQYLPSGKHMQTIRCKIVAGAGQCYTAYFCKDDDGANPVHLAINSDFKIKVLKVSLGCQNYKERIGF
jgi:hypothetical protein